jgi:hypothetical protein
VTAPTSIGVTLGHARDPAAEGPSTPVLTLGGGGHKGEVCRAGPRGLVRHGGWPGHGCEAGAPPHTTHVCLPWLHKGGTAGPAWKRAQLTAPSGCADGGLSPNGNEIEHRCTCCPLAQATSRGQRPRHTLASEWAPACAQGIYTVTVPIRMGSQVLPLRWPLQRSTLTYAPSAPRIELYTKA